MATSTAPPTHHFTVDVEEYFQVSAFEGVATRDRWEGYASRLHVGMDSVLGLLDAHRATATFFTLGWVARRFAPLLRDLVAAGHEVASHGDWHERVTSLDPDRFRTDIRESKAALEQAIGRSVNGYRAPSFSITPASAWAFEILVEEGFRYDSSRFPVRRPGYGWPGSPVAPHVISTPSGALLEYPLTTWKVAGVHVPAAGGGYLRQFPLAVLEAGFAQAEAEHRPGMFYIHPWELDPEQPRLPVGWLTRVRHYRGLARTRSLLASMLQRFRFSSVERAPAIPRGVAP